MILHSVIPSDIVFKDYDISQDYEFIEIEYLGEKVVVYNVSNNQFAINRVISTSPKAYLNPRLMPGQIVSGIFETK